MSAVTSNLRHEPLFDVDLLTGASLEVFYADRTLETFGVSPARLFARRLGYWPIWDGLRSIPPRADYAADL
jgi:hypothetical protein